MADSESATAGPSVRKIRVHKRVPKEAQSDVANDAQRNADIDRRIAELIPGLADVSVSGSSQQSTMDASASVRQGIMAREADRRRELAELATIFDMSVPNPVDNVMPDPSKPWVQKLRPEPKRVSLSQYQIEMINYQRMLLRKNIWYYRDRLNNARGPCPLHTLKECWVQGVIDENTLVWGQGLYDWLPAKNVKLLLPMIRTPEVRFGAWLKRTFALKPALNRIREQRAEYRDPSNQSKQVEWMR